MTIPYLLALFTLLNTCAVFSLGIYALRSDTTARLNRVFFLLCFSISIWSLANFFGYLTGSDQINFLTNRIGAIGYCMFAGFLLHFSLLLTGNKKVLKQRWNYLLLYAPGTIFMLRAFTSFLTVKAFFKTSYGWRGVIVPSDSIWFWAYSFYYISFCLACIWLTYRWGRRTKVLREKKQAKVILIAALLSLFLCSLNEIILPAMHLYVLPGMSVILLIFWITGMGYSIIKYKLMTLTSEVVAEEILKRVMDLIILITPDGMISRVDRRVEEVLGFDNQELVDTPITGIIAEETSAIHTLIDNCHQLPASGSVELNYRTKNGDLIPVQIWVSPIHDHAQDLLGFVMIGQDMRLTKRLQQEIEERKEIELALRESNEKLQEIDKMKTDFLSTVSHELRTPLTSIVGFAKIIKKRFQSVILPGIQAEDSKLQKTLFQMLENIEIIISEGERLTSLINDVLDIAKMEAGKVDWKMAPLSFTEVVDQAIAATKVLVDSKGLRFVKEIEPNLPEVTGDQDRLIQVMINLISNAVKFTERGEIHCIVVNRENELLVKLSDTGIGVAKQDQTAIFEKFKQVGDTLTGKPKGTGLGLPICKEIIEKHGGRIWVESAPSQGSTFAFTLPLGFQSIYSSPELDQFISNLKTQLIAKDWSEEGIRKKILVVDDDASIRFLLKQVLENEGHQVMEAKDGVDALHQIKNHPPDLVVLDVMMPYLNGFEVAAVLKSDHATANIPIIILSVIEDKTRGRKFGIDRYFTKPIDMEEFVRAVEGLIRGSTTPKVLIVNEDQSIIESLIEVLKTQGFQKIVACSGQECIEKAISIYPDMVIVDALIAQKYELKNKLRLEQGLGNIMFFLLGEVKPFETD